LKDSAGQRRLLPSERALQQLAHGGRQTLAASLDRDSRNRRSADVFLPAQPSEASKASPTSGHCSIRLNGSAIGTGLISIRASIR
jgi:hypothetical protein